ncbi:MAG: aldo/keto reductase [Verrucomicrobia bacterium]|nr:aldo/keto reductase [Verrucomicrobiota bacterium]
MKTQRLGTSRIEISRLAYGCMRISGSWDRTTVDDAVIQRGIEALEAAVDAGYTFFDHADIYGDTACESIYGHALQKHPDWRDRLVVATKCGIRFEDEPNPGQPHRYDFSYEHILTSVEESLQRLRLQTIDLLMLHRPDFLADPAEIAQAFAELRADGKVREFGVSNFRPSLFSAVQSALPFALQVNQVEIHPLRVDCFTDGTLDQCLERGVTPMAWSPLAQGRVGAGQDPKTDAPNREHHLAILAALDQAAAQFGCDRTVIALAWLLRHPAGIVPVVGSAKPENIRNAALATNIEMDRDTWYRILLAARGVKLP